MINIQESGRFHRVSLFHLGFRPFFLGAAISSIISMLAWLGVFSYGLPLLPDTLPPSLWHAHEMIYGYGLAVIAGFLLTAVRNWTGVETLHGRSLFALLLAWIVARVLMFIPLPEALGYAALFDTAFAILFILALFIPVYKVRQWSQSMILLVLLLFPIGNLIFYLASLGWLAWNPRIGLGIGFYSMLAMILIMSRRVIPFFIEKGVGYSVTLTNWKWVDISGMVLFIAFALLSITGIANPSLPVLAGALCVVHGIRLVHWNTPGLWRKPLLWVLYLAYLFLVLGFALSALEHWLGLPASYSLHAFAVGGIGVMTIGMMSRVALGHTGRNVFEPPRILGVIFLLMVAALLSRVVFPLFDLSHYALWIQVSQILWVIAFSLFVVVYAPMLIKPRIDGQYG